MAQMTFRVFGSDSRGIVTRDITVDDVPNKDMMHSMYQTSWKAQNIARNTYNMKVNSCKFIAAN